MARLSRLLVRRDFSGRRILAEHKRETFIGVADDPDQFRPTVESIGQPFCQPTHELIVSTANVKTFV